MSPSDHIHRHPHLFIFLTSVTPCASSYISFGLKKNFYTINIDILYSFILGPFFPLSLMFSCQVFSVTCKPVILKSVSSLQILFLELQHCQDVEGPVPFWLCSDLVQSTCLKRNNLSLFPEQKCLSV